MQGSKVRSCSDNVAIGNRCREDLVRKTESDRAEVVHVFNPSGTQEWGRWISEFPGQPGLQNEFLEETKKETKSPKPNLTREARKQGCWQRRTLNVVSLWPSSLCFWQSTQHREHRGLRNGNPEDGLDKVIWGQRQDLSSGFLLQRTWVILYLLPCLPRLLRQASGFPGRPTQPCEEKEGRRCKLIRSYQECFGVWCGVVYKVRWMCLSCFPVISWPTGKIQRMCSFRI